MPTLAEIKQLPHTMRSNKRWIIIFSVILFNCSPSREVIMPFKNLDYSIDRMLPLKTSDPEFAFRIWISNSTSIDRVISISMNKKYEVSKGKIVSSDSSYSFNGNITEFGKLYKGKKSQDYYRQIVTVPKSGFIEFKHKLDQLNLLTTNAPKKQLELVLHEPFSTYIVEIKDQEQFNTFRFHTYYPKQTQPDEPFTILEKLILEEFNLQQYSKLYQ